MADLYFPTEHPVRVQHGHDVPGDITAPGWLLSRDLTRPCIIEDASISPGGTPAVTNTVWGAGE